MNPQDLARELNELLTELGNSEFSQARKALAHAEVSTTPERELTLAIGHLQSADGYFEQACAREHHLAINSMFAARERSHWEKSVLSYQMCITCKAGIATIYALLDQSPLAQRYANEIVAIFPKYSEAVLKTYYNDPFFGGPPTYLDGANVAAARVLEEAKEARKFMRTLGVEPPEGSFQVYFVRSQALGV